MKRIKCVIAAGGLGTRLQGFRNNDKTKVLLEVNQVPMINLQLSQLISWGIEDFIIITNPDYDKLTKEVVNNSFPNINIEYSIQEQAKGISHALLMADSFVTKHDAVLFVLGDNFFGENPISNVDFKKFYKVGGCIIFSKSVENPSEFGVASIDKNENVIYIEEKPEFPNSNLAVVGLYIFDNTVMKKIKTLNPSKRGEFEITDLINKYIKEDSCKNNLLNSWWVDAGTPERILELEKNL